MNNRVRTRIAPSPTGPAHIGNLRTALFNYLFAKKHGGDFILRVEDTDSKREVDGSFDYILSSLEWLGIPIDESPAHGGSFGPYKQSERKDIYKKYVQLLVDSGNAYYAFDTTEELDAMREKITASGVKSSGYNWSVRETMKNSLTLPKDDVDSRISSGENYVVRFKMPRSIDVKFKDEIRGWISFSTNDLDDKVIWKSSDGLPTYHLANVVDDHLMEITHVIRGEEWVSSTPLHILLYKAFGWEHPIFAHLPLILDPSGKKLGKRNKYGIPVFALDWSYVDEDGNVNDINGFRDAGYEPKALLNYLALLGWSPGNNLEFMTLDEMVSLFSIERINKSGAKFDLDKLNAFNAHYVRNMSDKEIFGKMFWDIAKSSMAQVDYNADSMKSIINMAKERSVFAKDLYPSVSFFFENIVLGGDVALKNHNEFHEVMSEFYDHSTRMDWTAESIKSVLTELCEKRGFKLGKVLPDLRLALTGGIPGPDLPTTMEILGLTETIDRIENLLYKTREAV